MKKYYKGRVIRSLDELAKQEFIFFGHKVYHKGWYLSWPLRNVLALLEGGKIFEAVRIENAK